MALPNGYKRVEYIQSSGTQYIDTAFTPNNKTRIEVKFLWHGGTGGYLFGAVDTNNAKALTATLDATGGNWRFDGTKYKYTTTANTTYIAKIDSTGLTINGTLYKYEGTVSSFTALNTLAVCGGKNSNGTMATAYFAGKIYYFKIYDDGTLVRDLVPCKNASGAVGLYDTVNGVFYANKGSGTFTAGPEVVDEYKIVNATELDGAITATADAIRAKTGSSEKIVWDATRGFANAIPSGSKVATGTVDITGEYWLNTSPVTVSGLGFTPSFIIMYASPDDIVEANNNNDYGQADMYGAALYTIYSEGETRTVCPDLGEEDGYDEDTGEEWIYEYPSASVYGGFLLTPTADGFKISSTDVNINYWYDMKANYIALGLGGNDEIL